MPINFPNTPTPNQQYTYSGKTWQWNGSYWDFLTASPGVTSLTAGSGLSGNTTIGNVTLVTTGTTGGGTFTGGTVSGATYFSDGLSANTFSATTLLGNASNLSNIISGITRSDLRNAGIPYVVYTDYSAETTTSTAATNTLSTFTLTIPDSEWPIGGVLIISGLFERTAGSGSITMGLDCNGSTRRYITGGGQSLQWEWQIIKETSTTIRYGQGPSNTGNPSYSVHNSQSVTANVSGGNYVFTFYMFVVSAGATVRMNWMKGMMLP